jgi:hypothetical protein
MEIERSGGERDRSDDGQREIGRSRKEIGRSEMEIDR